MQAEFELWQKNKAAKEKEAADAAAAAAAEKEATAAADTGDDKAKTDDASAADGGAAAAGDDANGATDKPAAEGDDGDKPAKEGTATPAGDDDTNNNNTAEKSGDGDDTPAKDDTATPTPAAVAAADDGNGDTNNNNNNTSDDTPTPADGTDNNTKDDTTITSLTDTMTGLSLEDKAQEPPSNSTSATPPPPPPAAADGTEPAAAPEETAPAPPPPVPPNMWRCPSCTFDCKRKEKKCPMCSTKRPPNAMQRPDADTSGASESKAGDAAAEETAGVVTIPSSTAAQPLPEFWECSKCTLKNNITSATCGVRATTHHTTNTCLSNLNPNARCACQICSTKRPGCFKDAAAAARARPSVFSGDGLQFDKWRLPQPLKADTSAANIYACLSVFTAPERVLVATGSKAGLCTRRQHPPSDTPCATQAMALPAHTATRSTNASWKPNAQPKQKQKQQKLQPKQKQPPKQKQMQVHQQQLQPMMKKAGCRPTRPNCPKSNDEKVVIQPAHGPCTALTVTATATHTERKREAAKAIPTVTHCPHKLQQCYHR